MYRWEAERGTRRAFHRPALRPTRRYRNSLCGRGTRSTDTRVASEPRVPAVRRGVHARDGQLGGHDSATGGLGETDRVRSSPTRPTARGPCRRRVAPTGTPSACPRPGRPIPRRRGYYATTIGRGPSHQSFPFVARRSRNRGRERIFSTVEDPEKRRRMKWDRFSYTPGSKGNQFNSVSRRPR